MISIDIIAISYIVNFSVAFWLFQHAGDDYRYDMIGIFLEGPCSLDSLYRPWGLSLVPAAAQAAWGREAHRLASHWFEFRFRGVETSWDLPIHPQYLTTLKGLHTAKTPCCPDLVAVGALGRSALARAFQDINLISVCWRYLAFLFGILIFKLLVESFSCRGLRVFFSNQAHLFTLLQSTAPALISQTHTGKQLFRTVLGGRYARMFVVDGGGPSKDLWDYGIYGRFRCKFSHPGV